jgi:RNA polymerase sigma factor (sigma-70 family)
MIQPRLEQFEDAIASRARMLSHRYGIPYEDLYQEGLATVISVTKKNKDFHDKTLFKAINNWFSYIERKARNHSRIISSYPVDDLAEMEDDRAFNKFEAVERRIDLERLCAKMNPTCELVGLLILKGLCTRDISKAIGITYSAVSHHVKHLERMMNE